MILLQGHAVTLTLMVATKICAQHIISIWWSFLCNSFITKILKTKLWGGHDFASMSCCDLDLQGHAVTLTFKVATQMLCVHIVHIATYSRTKFHSPSFNSYQRIQIFSGQTDWLTDRLTDRGQTYSPLPVWTPVGYLLLLTMTCWQMSKVVDTWVRFDPKLCWCTW